MHSVDDIHRASAAWVWFPRDSDQERTDLQLVRYPARFGGGVRGSQVDSTADAATVLDRAIDRTRAWGETRLTFWTNASDRPDLEDELRRRGAEHIDTLAVLARPIGVSPIDASIDVSTIGAAIDVSTIGASIGASIDVSPIDVPSAATAEIVHALDQVREVDAINVPVWKQDPLDEDGLRTELAELTAEFASGRGARVLGRLDGVPVSTGGCTIVDGFVRLWGAATLESARGRGAYRAVLAERLRIGASLGATTALVKGRIATSAPILTRAGFTHYGDERGYRMTV